ncbi:acylhydrolase [Arachidicoccus ginsenosidimutans]|uniref:SGNH/GDSL hydrolase family protein n=1 Tax=Arachidicoccus sp. BS20 TaxID=1850526 RepID=UPI0007F0757E|nr:SGNH/GDSL hydrolase family protein [Arachidicoccus sp. BS20]ANI88352.1 acylhydrolase [Arachidicoccus sp. BS20]
MKKQFLLSTLFLLSVAGLNAQKKDVDWANFARFDSANQAVKLLPKSDREVVFMGNSITEGWINQDPSFFSENKFINRGISGQTTSQMLVRFRKDVIDLHPKVVIILAGTNDIAGNTGFISLDNILGNLISMCELAKANHIKPILCSLLPASDYPWSPGREPNIKIPKLNAMIKDYADKHHIHYVDYFSAMTDGNNAMRKNLAADGVVHPNLDGDKIMEKVALPVIKKTL